MLESLFDKVAGLKKVFHYNCLLEFRNWPCNTNFFPLFPSAYKNHRTYTSCYDQTSVCSKQPWVIISNAYSFYPFRPFSLAPCQKISDYWSLEAVVQRCSVKKVFLKISQNSQENTCGRVSFLINLQSLTQVFSREFCGISMNNFFYRTSLVAASGSQASLSQIQSYWDTLDVLYIWYQN